MIDEAKLIKWLDEKIMGINQKPYNDLTIERAIAFEDVLIACNTGEFDIEDGETNG